jgi:hypothetical protein
MVRRRSQVMAPSCVMEGVEDVEDVEDVEGYET